jgi:hypothetical protein
MAIVNMYRFVDLGSIRYRGGAIEFFFTFDFNYIIICIKLSRCVEQKPELVAQV